MHSRQPRHLWYWRTRCHLRSKLPLFRAHPWDGKVTIDEINGIKDQSIGMLAVAFVILISTAIEAKGSGLGQSITNFHATIVLNLSLINNTSTFIWFLLWKAWLSPRPGRAGSGSSSLPFVALERAMLEQVSNTEVEISGNLFN